MIEFDALHNLDRPSLIRLAELLEANLLAPPFSKLTLRDHVAEASVAAVSACLNELDRRLAPPAQIALVLRSFAAGRQMNRSVSELIDVVVSGPNVTEATRNTGVVMRELFNKARERVLIVGFAIHQGSSVFQALAERFDVHEALEVTMCIDVRREPTNTSLDSHIVSSFARNFIENEWPGKRLPRVYYDPRSLALVGSTRSALHAKCVVIDGQEALVTSANFTEAAQVRNIELGLLVNAPAVAGRIEQHFDSLIQNGHLDRLPLPSE